MLNLKKLQLVKELKNIQPKLKWLMYSGIQDYNMNTRYIDLMTGTSENHVEATEEYLNKTVREMLVKEFSPSIKNMKSFELLADTVIHNMKKKQLEELEEA